MRGSDDDEELALDAVRRHCEHWRVASHPDLLLNGRGGFYGEDADDLIRAMADGVGLPFGSLEHVSFKRFFEPERGISLLPVLLLRRLFAREEPADLLPLTATDLAVIMARLQEEARLGPVSGCAADRLESGTQ